MFKIYPTNVAHSFLLAGAVIAFTPSVSIAEVQVRDCPYNCENAGIQRSQCKDWRAEGKCYVEDLRAPSSRGSLNTMDSNNTNLDRKIVMVNKPISSGNREKVKLERKEVEKIDVVIRRQGASTETKLNATIEGTSLTANPQQVDRNDSHVLSWNLGLKPKKGQQLLLEAIDGDVFVESVHVFYHK